MMSLARGYAILVITGADAVGMKLSHRRGVYLNLRVGVEAYIHDSRR